MVAAKLAGLYDQRRVWIGTVGVTAAAQREKKRAYDEWKREMIHSYLASPSSRSMA